MGKFRKKARLHRKLCTSEFPKAPSCLEDSARGTSRSLTQFAEGYNFSPQASPVCRLHQENWVVFLRGRQVPSFVVRKYPAQVPVRRRSCLQSQAADRIDQGLQLFRQGPPQERPRSASQGRVAKVLCKLTKTRPQPRISQLFNF